MRTQNSEHGNLISDNALAYLSLREAQQAIWILEEARPEHAKAVEMLNERGVGRIWLIKAQVIRIGNSAPAPLFTVIVKPSEMDEHEDKETTASGVSPTQARKREFLYELFKQARTEGIDSPFKDRAPSIHGSVRTHAKGPGLVYIVAVNKDRSRALVSNMLGKWTSALAALADERTDIDAAITSAGLSGTLVWPDRVGEDYEGDWTIAYHVDAGWDSIKLGVTPGADLRKRMREINLAAAAMKTALQPHIDQLDPSLEEDSAVSS